MNYWNSLEQGSLLSRKFLFSSMNLKGTQTKLWCSSLEQQESPHLQSTLSNFREERAHLHFVHPSPHILWHLWIDHCYLCLTPWKGSVSPTYRMMGWCWRLSLHSQGNHTFFFSTDLLYTTGLILWSFPYLLLDEKKTTHTVFYRTLLKVSKCEMSISLDAC